MLPGLASQPPARVGRKLGKGDLQVRQRDVATAPQHEPAKIAETPAAGEGERGRKAGDTRRQPPDEPYAERRRRSRISSTKIGTRESRITIPTTMWM
jgi:hypothetical protein